MQCPRSQTAGSQAGVPPVRRTGQFDRFSGATRVLALAAATALIPLPGSAQPPEEKQPVRTPAKAAESPAVQPAPASRKASTERPKPQNTAAPQGCELYRSMARSAVPSRERVFALRALEGCPRNPATARLLERAVAGDDYAARAAALKSLETHLDRASLPFLIDLYYENSESTDIAGDHGTETRIFEYLSSLASPTAPAGAKKDQPGLRTELARVLRRGLHHANSRIRQAALRGLGRLDQSQDWPLIQQALRDPAGPGERIAALQAARRMQSRDSIAALAAARAALGLPNALSSAPLPGTAAVLQERPEPGVEQAAIELLGSLSGPRAFESLLVYRIQNAHGPNLALLQKTIAAGWDPKRSYAVALAPARLHALATERSEIRGVVATQSILYIEESTSLGYRLPPAQNQARPESNWLRVRTTDGLSGWVHASRARRLTPES